MPDEVVIPVAPVDTALVPLKRIIAKKEIPRALGVPIAPGQGVYLPQVEADAAIEAGLATDPDAPAPAKAKG
jgi:hypothetical protein